MTEYMTGADLLREQITRRETTMGDLLDVWEKQTNQVYETKQKLREIDRSLAALRADLALIERAAKAALEPTAAQDFAQLPTGQPPEEPAPGAAADADTSQVEWMDEQATGGDTPPPRLEPIIPPGSVGKAFPDADAYAAEMAQRRAADPDLPGSVVAEHPDADANPELPEGFTPWLGDQERPDGIVEVITRSGARVEGHAAQWNWHLDATASNSIIGYRYFAAAAPEAPPEAEPPFGEGETSGPTSDAEPPQTGSPTDQPHGTDPDQTGTTAGQLDPDHWLNRLVKA